MPQSRKSFLSSDFLLDNEVAKVLYEEFAASLPILDYHNHLSPAEIAADKKFDNVSEIWLKGDHYKWRAMRANGIEEEFCSGNAGPFEKFRKWSETVPYTLRNPLYHWTHLELRNYFGIDELLNLTSAEEIYTKCNDMLQQPEFSTQGLLKKMKVEVVCTTDDPADTLEHHQYFATAEAGFKMYPSFRPDKAYRFDDANGYNQYLGSLEKITGRDIGSLKDLLKVLADRIQFFNSLGCRSADHGLEFLWYDEISTSAAEIIFNRIRKGETLAVNDQLALRGHILNHLSILYHQVGWVQQFHLGALRNNNARMLAKVGPDTGFDTIGEFDQAKGLARFLDALDSKQQLTKTILYNLNPSQNEMFAAMAGTFNDGTTPGKIQYGSGWWFLDQKDGMQKQMNALSSIGLLSRFVGMTTDSRSFLSFPRHEYFRRILCNLIGKDVVNGEIPDDIPMLGKMVANISYHNAKDYFNF